MQDEGSTDNGNINVELSQSDYQDDIPTPP
jgi:hypothetical protein